MRWSDGGAEHELGASLPLHPPHKEKRKAKERVPVWRMDPTTPLYEGRVRCSMSYSLNRRVAPVDVGELPSVSAPVSPKLWEPTAKSWAVAPPKLKSATSLPLIGAPGGAPRPAREEQVAPPVSRRPAHERAALQQHTRARREQRAMERLEGFVKCYF